MRVLFIFWNKEKGQGLVEYSLLIAMLVIITVATMALFGISINGLFADVIEYVEEFAI